MALQTSVSAQPAVASPGLVEHAYKDAMILSRVCDEANGISPGLAVVRDGHDDKVDLPTSAAEVSGGTLGWAVRDSYFAYQGAGYANADPMPVLYEGVIWVQTEEAVTFGQKVYVRHTSDGGSNLILGKARNDSAPLNGVDTCTLVEGAIFLATTTAAGYALVYKTGVSAKGAQFSTVSTRIADVSTASSAYAVAPISGEIVAVYGVLGGTISGANSAVTTAIAGVAITGGNFTVAFSGSAAGDVDSATPTAANTVTAGQLLTATTDGASTGTQTEDVFFVIRGTTP